MGVGNGHTRRSPIMSLYDIITCHVSKVSNMHLTSSTRWIGCRLYLASMSCFPTHISKESGFGTLPPPNLRFRLLWSKVHATTSCMMDHIYNYIHYISPHLDSWLHGECKECESVILIYCMSSAYETSWTCFIADGRSCDADGGTQHDQRAQVNATSVPRDRQLCWWRRGTLTAHRVSTAPRMTSSRCLWARMLYPITSQVSKLFVG